MTYNSAKNALKEYLRVITIKVILAVIFITIIAVFNRNLYSCLSALLGFLLALLPALVYIKVVYTDRVLPAEVVMVRHKKAELYKFFTNILGFVIVFICFRQVHLLVLFASYLVTLSAYWLALLRRVD